MKTTLKIAVVELGPRHDELFPVWQRLAEKCGHDIEFFVAPIHEARDIFSLLESPRPKCYLTSAKKTGGSAISRYLSMLTTAVLRLRTWFMLSTRYDLVIANTVDIDGSYESFLRFVRKPMLAVVHNGYALTGNDKLARLRNDGDNAILVLSRHIEDFLARHDVSAFTVHPDIALRDRSFAGPPPEEATFCVQGYINFFRRNYDSLLTAAVKLKEKNVRCKFKIVGRLGRASRIMQQRVDQLGVAEYFTFVGNAESYADYYREIRACRFLLVLVDDSRMIYNAFFKDKCTSSLGITLGLGIIPVINKKLAEIYDIADFGVTYESDDVLSGIEAALSYDSRKMEMLADNLAATRARFGAASVGAFEAAIESALDP